MEAALLAGLDPADQLFIRTRAGILEQCLTQWLEAASHALPNHTVLPAILRAGEISTSPLLTSDERECWRERLSNVAEYLNLTLEVQQDIFRLLVSRHYFAPRLTLSNLATALEVRDEMIAAIAETFTAIPLTDEYVYQLVMRGTYRNEQVARQNLLDQRIEQLAARGCGRDMRVAKQVAYELQEDRVQSRATERARRILLRYLEEGPV